MPRPKDHADRIIYVRKGHRLSQQSFAKMLGTTRGAVGNWERGKGIKRENLQNIADTFMLPFDWLAMDRGEQPTMPSNAAYAIKLGNSKRPIVETFDPDEQSAAEEAGAAIHQGGRLNVPKGEIPQVEARIGLGHATDEPTINIPIGGGAIAAVPVVATWKIPESVLRRRLSGPIGRIHIVECEGDSMEPTILSGDFVFIDTDRRIPSPEGIFALHDGFGQTLKRLELIPNSDPPRVMLIPDNPRHSKFERSLEEVNIIGRYLCRLTMD